MPFEHRQTVAKDYATRLQEAFALTGHKLKRSRALETIADWYGYQNFSDLRCNPNDLVMTVDLRDLLNQAVSIVNLHPDLGFTLSDLKFEVGAPRVLFNDSMEKAKQITALAHGFQDWYQLVLAGAPVATIEGITKLHSSIYSEEQLPLIVYQVYSMQYDLVPLTEAGDYPWDVWERKALNEGIPASLSTLARSSLRECYQHSWECDLCLFCGLYDNGEGVLNLAHQYPSELTQALQYLMDTDGGNGELMDGYGDS
tara:strand:+ start:4885 stop:5652 length:768 start_codon:yes stop_codon:yes gene_type:complete